VYSKNYVPRKFKTSSYNLDLVDIFLVVSGYVQSAKKFGQLATGEQPSHERNACLTQNLPTPPIG
jgi:hypothetical protein